MSERVPAGVPSPRAARVGVGLIPALLVLILAGSFGLQLHRLGDGELTVWDESFHAIVARNLLGHPLNPTLIDQPYLPYDYRDWHENHVWMHKPILPLWTIAASFAVLGVDRFSLRLPSAILSTLGVLLTYLIGKRLIDRRAGIVAAAIQAASPAVVGLVHGRLFADHVDVSLLFWVEVAVLFLLRAAESGRWRDVVVCGVATGLAYLSKSYLALIVPGLAVVTWVLSKRCAAGRASIRIRGRHVAGVLGTALLTIAPWTIYSFVNYRNEFLFEYAAWWHHLAGEWEDWGAPWQRVIFDYLPNLHQFLYVPVAVAALGLVVPAVRERSFGLLFLLAWVAGVFVPHLIAPTKTPTATLIALPPLLMLLGALVSRALRGDLWSQAVWAGVAVAGLMHPAVIRPPNRGYALEPGIAAIADKHPWVLWQAGAAFVDAAILYAIGAWLSHAAGRERACRIFRTAIVVVAVLGSFWHFAKLGRAAFRLAHQVNPDQVDYADVGAFARANLPKNAVLLVAGMGLYEHQLAMFHSDRTSYGRFSPDVVTAIRQAGGDPYLVTHPSAVELTKGLSPVYATSTSRPAIYRLP